MSTQQDPQLQRRALDALPVQLEELSQEQYDRLRHALSYYEDVSQAQREALLEVRQQLWRAQREYHALFLTNPSPIAVIDEDGQIKKYNSAFLAMFRILDDDARPNIGELCPKFKVHLNKIAIQQNEPIECRLYRLDGSHFAGEIQALATRSKEQLEHILLFRDVTQQKNTQQRLDLFESVVTQTKDAVFVVKYERDQEGGDGQAVYINEAFERMFDLKLEYFKDHSYKTMMVGPQTDLHLFYKMFDELSQTGYARQHVTLYKKNGDSFWADTSTTRIPSHEEGSFYHLSIIRDASQQQELIDRMMHVDRILAMGTLAAGISHEISNPLTYAKANVDYVSEQLRQIDERLELDRSDQAQAAKEARWASSIEHNKELLHALKDAQHGLDRASTILDDLRMFAHKREPADDVVNLNQVIKTAIALINNELIHRAKLRLKLNQTLYVRGDQNKLEQVLLNLLLNALQALPADRTTENELCVRLFEQEQSAVIQIEDNGIGIKPEHLSHIFEPFFTTKPTGQGTGLGLAIAQNTINAHGGTLSAESKQGKTCFTITLEAVHVAKPAYEQITSERASERPTLMLLDDEPQILRVMERLLQSQYQVKTYTRALDCLEALRRGEHVDLIVCDVMMPELNGVGFYKLIHDELPEHLDRLLFISGGAFSVETTNFLEMLEVPLLKKPFQPQELFELLSSELARIREKSRR